MLMCDMKALIFIMPIVILEKGSYVKVKKVSKVTI